MQLIILWVGLVGDIVTKGSLTFQLIRLAIRHTWVNFGVILGTYIISSCFVRPAADLTLSSSPRHAALRAGHI